MPGAEHEQAVEPAGGLAAAGPVPGGAAPMGGMAGAVLRLQGAAGNAAVTRMLQRDTSSAGGVGTPVPSTVAPGDQSSAGGPAKVGPIDFKKLIADKDTSGIRQVGDFGPAEPGDRIKMVHILLEDTWWVGGSDRAAIKKIWEAFGTAGIVTAYEQNEALWDRCVAKDVDMAGLEALRPYREKFDSDVKAVANVYLKKNAEAIQAERGRLGVAHLNDPLGVSGGGVVNKDKVAEVQQLAAQVARADTALKALREIPVATMEVDAPPATPGGERGSAGGQPDGPAPAGTDTGEGPAPAPPKPAKVLIDVPFAPDRPPPTGAGGPAKGREKEFRTYEAVSAEHRRLTAARSVIAAKSPVLFSLSQNNEKAPAELAKMSPEDAAKHLAKLLDSTEFAIEKSGKMIGNGELDWRELSPIHEQLWKGMPAASKLDWSGKLAKSVAKGVIGDYKETAFWEKIGVAGLAGAAFIFSEIASAGMASFLWLAAGASVGAGQAAMSYKSYDDLRTAAQAGTSKETRLVSGEQVDEAQAAAILDAVFAFVDVAMAAKGAVAGARAVEAAARTSAREALAGLKGLAHAEPAKAAEALRTAIKDLGAQETIRRSGMTADDLIKLVGGEKTAEGKALREASRDASVAVRGAAGAGIDHLPTELPTALGRRLANKAYESVFKRWGALATPEARLEAMLKILNEELGRMGCPPLKAVVTNDIVLEGEHLAEQWAIGIRPHLLTTDTTFTSDQIWGLVVHETEHAEQWFTVAQLRHARDGESAATIAAKLGVPESVAEAAIGVQEGSVKGLRLVEGTSEWTAAEGIDHSIIGAGRPHRDATLDALKAKRGELNAAKEAWEKVEDLPVGDPLRQKKLAELEAANNAYDTAEIAYVRLPEEVGAYRAGGVAASSLTERKTLFQQLEAAKATESAAIADMKRLETELAAAATRGEDVAYRLRVDFYGASARADDALKLINDATDGLIRTAHGAAP